MRTVVCQFRFQWVFSQSVEVARSQYCWMQVGVPTAGCPEACFTHPVSVVGESNWNSRQLLCFLLENRINQVFSDLNIFLSTLNCWMPQVRYHVSLLTPFAKLALVQKSTADRYLTTHVAKYRYRGELRVPYGTGLRRRTTRAEGAIWDTAWELFSCPSTSVYQDVQEKKLLLSWNASPK